METTASPKITPVWQRPPAYRRSLPADWRSPAAIAGVARKRRSWALRVLFFGAKVLLAVAFFVVLNLVFSPEIWEALK